MRINKAKFEREASLNFTEPFSVVLIRGRDKPELPLSLEELVSKKHNKMFDLLQLLDSAQEDWLLDVRYCKNIHQLLDAVRKQHPEEFARYDSLESKLNQLSK